MAAKPELGSDLLTPAESTFTSSSREKIGKRIEQLSRRKWLRNQYAIGNTICSAFLRTRTCHVNHRERRFFFPEVSGDLPTIQTFSQPDVGDKRFVRSV